MGDRTRIRIDAPVPLIAEITPEALHELDLHAGTRLWTAFKATDVTVYPR